MEGAICRKVAGMRYKDKANMREEIIRRKRMLGITSSLLRYIFRLSADGFPVYRDVSTGAGGDEAFISPTPRKPLDAPQRLRCLGVCGHTCPLID